MPQQRLVAYLLGKNRPVKVLTQLFGYVASLHAPDLFNQIFCTSLLKSRFNSKPYQKNRVRIHGYFYKFSNILATRI
jgi:hypothetical protein